MSIQAIEKAMFAARSKPGNLDKYLYALALAELTVVTNHKQIYLRCPLDQPIPADLLHLEQGQSEGLPDGSYVDVYTINFNKLTSACGLTMQHFKSRVDTSNRDILTDFKQKLCTAMLKSIVQHDDVEEPLFDIQNLDIFIDKLLSFYDLEIVAGIAGFIPKTVKNTTIIQNIAELVQFQRAYMASLVTVAGVVQVPKMELLQWLFTGQLPTLSSDLFYYYIKNHHNRLSRKLATSQGRELIRRRLCSWILPALDFAFVNGRGIVFIPKSDRFLKVAEHNQMLEDMTLVEGAWQLKEDVLWSIKRELRRLESELDDRGLFFELVLARDRLRRENVIESLANSRVTSGGRFVEDLFSWAQTPKIQVDVVEINKKPTCSITELSDFPADESCIVEKAEESLVVDNLATVLNLNGILADDFFPEEEPVDILNTAMIVEDEEDELDDIPNIAAILEEDDDEEVSMVGNLVVEKERSTGDVSEECLTLMVYNGPLHDSKGFPFFIIFEDDLSEIAHYDPEAEAAAELERHMDAVLALTEDEASDVDEVSEEDEEEVVAVSWWEEVVDVVGGWFSCCTQRL